MIVDIDMKSPLKTKIVDLKNYHMVGKLIEYVVFPSNMEFIDTAIGLDSYLRSDSETRTALLGSGMI